MQATSPSVKTLVSFYDGLGRQKPLLLENGNVNGSDDTIYEDDLSDIMNGLSINKKAEVHPDEDVVEVLPPKPSFAIGKADPKPKVKKSKQGPKRRYAISSQKKQERCSKTSLTKLKKKLARLHRQMKALADAGIEADQNHETDLAEALNDKLIEMEATEASIEAKIKELNARVQGSISAQERIKAILKDVK